MISAILNYEINPYSSGIHNHDSTPHSRQSHGYFPYAQGHLSPQALRHLVLSLCQALRRPRGRGTYTLVRLYRNRFYLGK